MAGVPIRDQEYILKDLVNLKYLNLRDTGISNLSAIVSLTDLEYLNLHSNQEITSLAPLESLDHLRTLILAHVPVGQQAEMLASFEQLRYLNLRNTHLEDISFLSDLHRLKYLNLHSNPEIASIQPLVGLTSLEHLILRGVNVADQTSALHNLTALQTLNLCETGIADVAFLGDLMAQGALQDNPKLNIQARLDIRDNPIPNSEEDLYNPLRPRWKNISFASPVALPFHSSIPAPKFSHTSGFYDSEFTLTLTPPEPGLVIHYTLDSSSPTAHSPEYAQPILIQDLIGEPDVIASIEAISADWNKPNHSVRKAQVVRAVAFDPITGEASEIITQTFFVDPNGSDKHTLPVISLVTDKEHLFDEQTGIYMLGDAYIKAREDTPAGESVPVLENFHQRGRDWERPLSIELIDAGGSPLFSQNAGVRIHGSSSRQRPQKSLRLIARPEYDEGVLFTYPLFDDGVDNPENEVILLRNAGQDWMVSMIRDTVAQNLVSHTNLNTQGTQPVIAYLNGEYWGIYHLQERIDEFYLRNHFDIPLDQSVILRNNKQVFRGQPEDVEHYRNMLAFAQGEDLSSDENYQFVETLMDVDNYLDYMSANIIMGNTDWPHNNLYYWRKTTDAYLPDAPYGHDGRWRWMLFDLDWAFGFEGIGGGVNNNTLRACPKRRLDWSAVQVFA